jgi:hypothetical protein
MGYSASFTCKSPKAFNEMLEFMNLHYRESSIVLQTGLRARYSGLVHGGGIKYGAGSVQIGFNSPHNYEFSLLRWMALRVGAKRPFKSKGIPISVPWINCDNDFSSPILLDTDWPNPAEELQGWIVDEHGYQPQDSTNFVESLVARWAAQDAHIHTELKRLSALWEQRNEKA